MRTFRAASLAAAGVLLASTPALAAVAATGTMDVTATVSNSCILATNPLAFGTYDPVGVNKAADLNGTAALYVACTSGASAWIGLDMGSNEGGTGTRRMHDGTGSYLTYQLYKDAGRTSVWGDTDTAAGVGHSGTGVTQTHTVYGKVLLNQNVPSGTYQDVVTVTVNL